jgi:hypothetical protein
MTMHLEGPWLSTGGKKKGKHKFRNADEARKARDLDASWKELQKKWGVEAEEKKRKRALSAEVWTDPMLSYRGQNEKRNSVNTGGNAILKPSPVYTGTKMLGIGQLHKSNAVPVFSTDEAIDIARMRR